MILSRLRITAMGFYAPRRHLSGELFVLGTASTNICGKFNPAGRLPIFKEVSMFLMFSRFK